MSKKTSRAFTKILKDHLGELTDKIKDQKNMTPCQRDKRFRQRIMAAAFLVQDNPKTARMKCILTRTGVKFRRFDWHPVSKKPIMAQMRISFDDLRTNNDDECIQKHIDAVLNDFEILWDREDKRIEKDNLPKKKIVQKKKLNGKKKKAS